MVVRCGSLLGNRRYVFFKLQSRSRSALRTTWGRALRYGLSPTEYMRPQETRARMPVKIFPASTRRRLSVLTTVPTPMARVEAPARLRNLLWGSPFQTTSVFMYGASVS